MVVTVTILALIAGIAVVSYREPVARARLTHLFEQLERFDSRVRHFAESHQVPVRVKVDLDRGIFEAETDKGQIADIAPLPVPQGMKIKEFRLAGESRFSFVRTIPYNSRGAAPSWVLSIVTPQNQESIRLVIGATGQFAAMENERELLKLERQLLP